jgi:hypothetical protein
MIDNIEEIEEKEWWGRIVRGGLGDRGYWKEFTRFHIAYLHKVQ